MTAGAVKAFWQKMAGRLSANILNHIPLVVWATIIVDGFAMTVRLSAFSSILTQSPRGVKSIVLFSEETCDYDSYSLTNFS